MKKTIISLLMVQLAAGAAFGRTTDHNRATDAVKRSFDEKYNGAVVRKWSEINGTDEVKFKMNGDKDVAFFLNDGSWLRTETKIPWLKDLPRAVHDAFNNCEFKAWRVTDIERVTTPGATFYAVTASLDYGPDGSIPGDWVESHRLYYLANGTLDHQELLSR